MARYRTYKNGIYGHRYKGYYIIKGEKNKFSILNPDGSIFMENVLDYDECEWILDKSLASDEEKLFINQLYDREIYQLSALLVELMEKKREEGLNSEETILYAYTEKIRKRKANDRLK